MRTYGLASFRASAPGMNLHLADLMTETLFPPLSDRDHRLGSPDATVALVEYGDFECPHCGRAYPVIKRLIRELDGALLFVFRHYPINVGHARAQLAAEAAEAAAAQGRFWEMVDLLFENQDALDAASLESYAERIGLDVARFRLELETHVHVDRIAGDVEGAEKSGVTWTPTFFINGSLFGAAADFDDLAGALDEARGAVSRRRP
jgi:protein-disulfide isomerase